MSDKEVDYDYAMKIGSYLVAAEKGDNEALCMLGQLYGSEDAGVLKNEAFSLGCYTLAADRGNALAKCILYGYTEPYIVAETGKFDGFPPLSAHEVYFMGSLYGETRFKLQFRNMKRKGYTVRYEILENEKIINKKNGCEEEIYTVQWGDWIGTDKIELVVRNIKGKEGRIVIKVYVDDSECSMIIGAAGWGGFVNKS